MSLSLWLVPAAHSPFTKTTQELISDTIPKIFVSSDDQIQSFPPHVTVTSGISLQEKSPQEWLDGLDFSDFQANKNEVVLELDHLEAEDPFFRKMNLAINENENLRKVCAISRKAADLDESFAEKEYRPHLSLYYGDNATSDVKAKIPLIEMKIGFALGDLFACCGGALCMGGNLILVDTSKKITEWEDATVASRETPWAMWRASRGLL